MIGLQFPPFAGSSGVQRMLGFVRHLPAYGWDPAVLTASPKAYESVSDSALRDVPEGVPVVRAFALDAARHLAIGGRYPRFLATPDRWASWLRPAVREGRKLIEDWKPDVLWATFPVPTALLVGLRLAEATGLPLVADFRDPLAQVDYPEDAGMRARWWEIEDRVVRGAARAVFTAPGACEDARERYPDLPAERFVTIENGFDEAVFADAERLVPPRTPGGPKLLVHSGVLYPSERDPRAFFAALSKLKAAGRIGADTLRIRLRATGHDDVYGPALRQHDLTDVVELAPAVPYREALAEMMAADGLLLFQAANCNHQIPAKLYEYFRAGRPILVLTDPEGDTAKAVEGKAWATVATLHSAESIVQHFSEFLERIEGVRKTGAPSEIDRDSRKSRAKELAATLESASPFDTTAGTFGRSRGFTP